MLKGHSRPFVSEIKFLDIRLPEEHIPLFLRDFGVFDWSYNGWKPNKNNPYRQFGLTTLGKFIRLFWKISPVKGAKKAPLPKQYTCKDWHYAFLLGTIKDPVQTTEYDKTKREVL